MLAGQRDNRQNSAYSLYLLSMPAVEPNNCVGMVISWVCDFVICLWVFVFVLYKENGLS